MKNTLRYNLIAQLFLLLAAVMALIMTGSIDMAFASKLEILAGPRRYPRIILIFFIVMNLLLLAATLGQYMRQNKQSRDLEKIEDLKGKQRALGVFLALAVFVLLFETVGYLLITVPLLVFVAIMNGARLSLSTLAICIVMLVVCLLMFRYGINIVLPEGLLGIDALF